MTSELAIDARWMVSGIGTYIRCLLEGLSSSSDNLRVRVITRPNHIASIRPLFPDALVTPTPIYSFSEQWMMPRIARGCDLLHVPHFNVPLGFAGKILVTIHDLILTTVAPYKSAASSRLYAAPMLQLAARKATHIITVSESSKNEIIERLRVPASKISVIHNAVRPCFYPRSLSESRKLVQQAVGISGPYLLCVGNFKPHKNVIAFLRSIALLQAQGKFLDHSVLLIGEDAQENAAVHAEISALQLGAVVKQISHADEILLACAYSAAAALVAPSTSEGFGLPIVEAMACGAPVICSPIPVFQEIAQDAASFSLSTSSNDIANAITGLLSSPSEQQSLRHKGLMRAAEFTPQIFLERHLEIYKRLCHAPRRSHAPQPARESYEPLEH